MNSGEGLPQSDVELSIPTIERFNIVQQNWDEVVKELKILKADSKHDLSSVSNKTTKYCMSTLPYFSTLLRSVEDEPEESKITLISSAIIALTNKQVNDVIEIYPDMEEAPERAAMSEVVYSIGEIFEDSDSDEELVGTINEDFMAITLYVVNSINSSSAVARKIKKTKMRETVHTHIQDIAKIAGGTAIGLLLAQRLVRKRG